MRDKAAFVNTRRHRAFRRNRTVLVLPWIFVPFHQVGVHSYASHGGQGQSGLECIKVILGTWPDTSTNSVVLLVQYYSSATGRVHHAVIQPAIERALGNSRAAIAVARPVDPDMDWMAIWQRLCEISDFIHEIWQRSLCTSAKEALEAAGRGRLDPATQGALLTNLLPPLRARTQAVQAHATGAHRHKLTFIFMK